MRQSDWCALCQDMNTSYRRLYIFTGCQLRLLCSVSSAFMDMPSLLTDLLSSLQSPTLQGDGQKNLSFCSPENKSVKKQYIHATCVKRC